jgi:hypothetical protein
MKYILTLVLGCAIGVLVAKMMLQPSVSEPTIEQRYNDAIALVKNISSVDIDLIEESRKPKLQMSNELRTQALSVENAMQFQLLSEVLTKLCSNDFGVVLDEPSHAISIEEAGNFVDNYLNGMQTFCAPGDQVLKGWFIEKEHIEELFRKYPEGNGIELCLGRKTTSGPDPLNLVWVVAKDPGTGMQLEPMFEDYAIYEYLRPCPPKCPKKENIFR